MLFLLLFLYLRVTFCSVSAVKYFFCSPSHSVLKVCAPPSSVSYCSTWCFRNIYLTINTILGKFITIFFVFYFLLQDFSLYFFHHNLCTSSVASASTTILICLLLLKSIIIPFLLSLILLFLRIIVDFQTLRPFSSFTLSCSRESRTTPFLRILRP